MLPSSEAACSAAATVAVHPVSVEASAPARTSAARYETLPLALGFGISTPEQVAQVGRWADAAVVGSALVNVIAEHGASASVAATAGAYVRWLKGQA